ncbi:MAG: VWA domain-containing protein [Thiolinea sp.]
MADLHFLHPQWLWLLLLVPVLWLLVLRHRRHLRGWDSVVDAELAPFVLTGQNRQRNALSLFIFSLLAALAILAAAGPAWEQREVPVFRDQQPLVVALDLSASMYAQDASPSRLEQARFKLIDLLHARKDGQTGLVVFAGDAFVVSPLTDDTRTIEAQMKSLTPSIMPVQGSQVDLAIQKSVELLQQAGSATGGILLMTDGTTDTALAEQAARDALSKGYKVSVLAFGTEQGAPIPLNNGGFLQDASGNTVMPRLEVAALRSLAREGGGLFAQAGLDDSDINHLSSQWASSSSAADLLSGGDRQVDAWVNEGVWLVVLMLPLVVLLFRRGWLLGLALLVVLPQSDPLQAGWQDVWQTPDQQAQAALQAGQAKGQPAV